MGSTVLSSQGATIKRHEMTGDILVARVIHGGLAERSGKWSSGVQAWPGKQGTPVSYVRSSL